MNSRCLVLTVVPRRGHQRCTNYISVFIFVRHVFMSSLLIKPIVQHHRSRVSPVLLRDHLWGNLTVKDPTQQARRRIEPGGAYQRSPSSSVTYSPPVPALFRSRTLPSKWEPSLCRAMTPCGLCSRSAICCTIVGHGPWCSHKISSTSRNAMRCLSASWIVSYRNPEARSRQEKYADWSISS